MNSCLVSIIIPVYNSEKYIIDCIDSCINQTYNNIEIIIIDDGSNDNSYQLCKQKKKNDCRVLLTKQSNLGANAARKKGVELSHGKWIMFVDADDILPYDSVEVLVANSNNVELVCGRFVFINENSEVIEKKWPFIETRNGSSDEFIKGLLEEKRWKCLWRQLFKKEIIKTEYFETNRNIKIGEDYLALLQIGLNVKQFRTLDNVVYNYRWYDNSTVHKFTIDIDYIEQITNFILVIFRARELRSQYKNSIVKSFTNFYLNGIEFRGINQLPFVSFLKRHYMFSNTLTFSDKFQLTLLLLQLNNCNAFFQRLKNRCRNLKKIDGEHS